MDDSELINEVLELTLAWQRGDANAEERARLERLLADNPQAILWYLRVVDDSLTLLDAATANKTATTATSASVEVYAEEPLIPYKVATSYWALAGHRPRWWLAVSIVACSLLVAYAALRQSDQAKSPPGKLAQVQPPAGATAASTSSGSARVVDISNVAWVDGAKQFAEWSLVNPGDTLKFSSGWVNLFLDNGAELLIEGPADVVFVSSKKVFARQGKLAARIGPGAVGFRIDTPHAKVIDRGTAFGLSVDRESHTSVVVYEGIVDLDVIGDAKSPRRRLASGEALSVNRKGQMSRITTVQSAEFLEPPQIRVAGDQPNRIITAVSDNVRSLQMAKYYRVIPGGFREDCRAYVDRLHEWNGIDSSGLPPFLFGGDYVMTFNDDKVLNEIEIAVTVSQPANLYVLLDDRIAPPDWLKRDFIDTRWKLGGDDGWEDAPKVEGGIAVGVGPGQSVEQSFSVWRRVVREPTTVVLGALSELTPPPAVDAGWSMYGVVATPLVGETNIN
jgi:hypothetical protein